MVNVLRGFVLAGVIVVGSGCVHTGFTPTSNLVLPSRPWDCYLDLILDGTPPDPYVVLGRVSTDSTAPGLWALGENEEAAMSRMRAEACAVGAHGLMRVDTGSQGIWTRDGYSKSTRGGAIAFVYVDSSGKPLPPPNGPRVVIHPGSATPKTRPPSAPSSSAAQTP